MKVSIIIPAFNEEKSIAKTIDATLEQIKQFSHEIIVVDDGSSDNTLECVIEKQKTIPSLKYISFSRNFGHQNAVRAGIENATGDCILSMDSDMQHPPELVPRMIEKWQEGYDIVFTVREDKNEKSFFKKSTSSFFYKIQNSLSDVKIERGAADFRLVDKRVAELLKDSSEYDLFLRGFFSWVGFKQFKMPYEPNERFAGTSKYTLKKMLNLAINGITSFSVKPLRFSIVVGFVMSFLSFLYLLYVVYIFSFTKFAISGWASVIACVVLLGGLQLIILGIIGEYLGKVFMQTKNRPSYIIKSKDL